MNVVKRGFTEHDFIEFGSKWEERMNAAAVFYLDQPVSNSGRLKHLILETAVQYPISVQAETICNVDQVLSAKENVITSDGIIINLLILVTTLFLTIFSFSDVLKLTI